MYVTVGHITDKTVLSSLYVDQVAAQNPALSQYIEQVVQESVFPNEQVNLWDSASLYVYCWQIC